VDFALQICSASVLERLAPALAGIQLSSVIWDKVDDPDKRSWDWETFVASLAPPENPAIRERFAQFMAPLGGFPNDDEQD
jgi:hypothetical protein